MHLLVLRFSAMGDVALMAPVLGALARRYSHARMTVVTRKEYEPFFFNIPGAEVIGLNLRDKRYRGLRGVFRLYKELRRLGPFDFGIDLHGSVRSRLIRLFFGKKIPFALIVKGRKEKRLQIKHKNKVLFQLPHVVERYMHVFERAGLSADTGPGPWITPQTQSRKLARDFLIQRGIDKKESLWIGLAPFAGHGPKTYPFDRIKDLVRLIDYYLPCKLFLFGGGSKEIQQLQELIELAPGKTVMVAGNLSIEGEIGLMDRLDTMIAMDSFNMHIAALLGRPVLSIWGSTHPFSGFGPFGQDDRNIIQIPVELLDCRPCSIFGNKGCYRGDLACMNWIEPSDVFAGLYRILGRTLPKPIAERRTVLSQFSADGVLLNQSQ